MRAGNLEFAEALRQLAQQAGVTLPSRERRSQEGPVLQICEAARTYFQELLFSEQGAGARDYLEKRGLSRDAIDVFELGLSPPDGESLKNHLVRAGHSTQQLAQAGLVHLTENGWARDLFRNRLMIPIRTSQGELGGFGGRTLDNATPKYLNSPRTALFDKGRILYGLYLAKEEAGRQGLVVVEGYMSVIAAHQNGFKNVVASMGTALTEQQVAAIRRLTSDVTMAMDSDAAGQQATLRSLESSWQVFQSSVAGRAQGTTLYQRMPVPELKIAVLPEGQDPDDVIRRSPGEWAQLVEAAVPLMDYLLGALSAQVDTSTPQGKARMVELMFPMIAAVPEPAQQDHYFQGLAEHLGVTQDTLRATIGRPSQVRRARSTGSRTQQATPSPFAKLDRDPLEDYCLALLLQHSELQDVAEDLRPEYFHRLENREIFNYWARQHRGSKSELEAASLRTDIDEELTDHLDSLVQKTFPPLDQRSRLEAIQDAVRHLENRYLRELKTEEGIRFTETPPDLDSASHQGVLEVNQRLKSNESKRNPLVPDTTQRGR